MSQYHPPQPSQGPDPSPGTTPPPPGQQFGNASQQGYGQQFGQASQAPFGAPPPAAGPQYGAPATGVQQYGAASAGGPQYAAPPYAARVEGGGLFDTSLRTMVTPKVARTAYVAIIVLASILALAGLLDAINAFSNAVSYGGLDGSSTFVLAGISSLLTGPALGFVVLTVGRLLVEFFLTQHRLAQDAATD